MNDTITPRTVGPTHGPRRSPVAVAAIVVAVGLQLVLLVPFTVASGLVAPLWAMLTLYAVWLVAATVLVVLARRRPLLSPVVPAVNAALLFGVITFGERVLGWTA